MKDDIHCMIDTETLGITAQAPMIQLGATIFDKDNGIIDKFSSHIDWQNAIDLGEISVSTLKWWMMQGDAARMGVANNEFEQSTFNAIAAFSDFQKGFNISHYWAHASFDFPILSHKCQELSIANPIPYWKCRDLRTLEALYPNVKWPERTGVYHSAIDDAVHQSKYVIKVLNII